MQPEPQPTDRPRRRLALAGGLVALALVCAGLAVAGASAFGPAGADPASASPMPRIDCPPSAPKEEAGAVSVGCVTFQADAATGTISAYAVTSNGTATTLVASLSVPALAGGAESLRHGYGLSKDDVRLDADGRPGFVLASRNGTAATLALPAGATVTVHEAVADWSPAGATVAVGAYKLDLRLPPGSTIAQDGNTLTLQLAAGPASFAPVGAPGGCPGMDGMHGPHGGPHGPHGFGHGGPRDGPGEGPRDGPRDGPRGPPA